MQGGGGGGGVAAPVLLTPLRQLKLESQLSLSQILGRKA